MDTIFIIPGMKYLGYNDVVLPSLNAIFSSQVLSVELYKRCLNLLYTELWQPIANPDLHCAAC